MELSGYTLIGSLTKLHGFKGEYMFIAEEPFPKKIEKWESVFIEIDGLPIPFFINNIRLTSDNVAIISFDDLSSSDEAKEFVGCRVWQLNSGSDKKKPKPDSLSFKNFKVYDTTVGYIGVVDSIIEYSHNVLFRILNHEEEILIPAIEDYILEINPNKMEIHLQTPEGLLDLNK
jgi:16S rRNA processing protein RimM